MVAGRGPRGEGDGSCARDDEVEMDDSGMEGNILLRFCSDAVRGRDDEVLRASLFSTGSLLGVDGLEGKRSSSVGRWKKPAMVMVVAV